MIMEVLVGPSIGIEVSSPPAYVRDRSVPPAADGKHVASASCLFQNEEDGGKGESLNRVGSGFGVFGGKGSEESSSSNSSSSVGAADEDSDDEVVSPDGDGEEGRSGRSSGAFGSLGSLEESLPIKRGLSNHFSGKSRSFANLSEVSSVKDLEKKENPLNKRRRVLIASKWTRRSSFYSWRNPKSMPLLTLNEDEEDADKNPWLPGKKQLKKDEDEDDEEENQEDSVRFVSKLQETGRLKSFKSKSCFSLADLHEQDQEQ